MRRGDLSTSSGKRIGASQRRLLLHFERPSVFLAKPGGSLVNWSSDSEDFRDRFLILKSRGKTLFDTTVISFDDSKP